MLRGCAAPAHSVSATAACRRRSASRARTVCTLPRDALPLTPAAAASFIEYPLALRSADSGAAPAPPLLRAPTLVSAPPASPAAKLRAAAQWAVLAAVATRAYGGRARNAATAAAAKLAGAPPAPPSLLEGLTLRLSLDVGRDPGTWMPPTWGRSGRRLTFDVAVRLRPGGECAPLAVGAFAGARFGPGRWSVGDASDDAELRLELPLLEPLSRGDVLIDDRLFLRTRAWGGVVARRGNLLLRQRRLFVREEYRLVGTFTCEALPPDGDEKAPELAPMRVRQRFTETPPSDVNLN